MKIGKPSPSAHTFIKSGHWDEAYARQVLAQLSASGDSVAAFARRRGLCPGRLWRWKNRLSQPSSRVAGSPAEGALAATFVPLVVPATRPPPPAATVLLGGPVRIELHTLDETSATWVASLVRSLEDHP